MNFFFMTLIATVAAHAQFMNGLMFRDPKAFVATFANADPTAINKVIEMVNGMIDVGEAEKQKAIDDHAAAVQVAKDEAAQLKIDQEDLIFKKGELHIATDKVTAAQAISELKAAEEAAALKTQNAARVDENEKEAFLNAETSRINAEKAVLEEVGDILESLKSNEVPSERRLLSVPSQAAFLATLAKQGLQVDPEAVDKVLASVAALIAEGEALRDAAQGAYDDAVSFTASSEKAYNDAVECHVAANDDLAVKLEHQATYQSQVDLATAVHQESVDRTAAANVDRDQKLAFKESEIARVNSETKDLNDVKDLLKGLL
jgi:hypothetical protein